MTAAVDEVRSADLARSVCEFVCPACRARLARRGEAWDCVECDRAFPDVAEFADLRLHSDRYLDLGAERAKALSLARIAPTADVVGLARAYYAMTGDVDERRRTRYLAHIARAEFRGAALAALLPRRGRILEIGCGTGGLLVAARRSGRDIEGVDIALRWIVLARRRLEDHGLFAPLTAASADRLPWPDGTFDAVVTDSVLEHLDEPATALGEWLRVVRRGGQLIVWSPNRFSLTPDPHVGLWGLGFLPSRLVPAYVERRRGCAWTVSPLSASEARRLAAEAGWGHVEIEAAPIPESCFRTRPGRVAGRIYGAARTARFVRDILRTLGPLWQLRARRESEA